MKVIEKRFVFALFFAAFLGVPTSSLNLYSGLNQGKNQSANDPILVVLSDVDFKAQLIVNENQDSAVQNEASLDVELVPFENQSDGIIYIPKKGSVILSPKDGPAKYMILPVQ